MSLNPFEGYEAIDGEVESIKLLRYQPGDVLVVTPSEHLTMARAEQIKQYTEAHLPGITALIVGPGYDLQLYRPTTTEGN